MLELHAIADPRRAMSSRVRQGIPEPLPALPADFPRCDRFRRRSRRRVRSRRAAAWATAAATTTGCCRCCRRAPRASPAPSTSSSSTRARGAERHRHRRRRHRVARTVDAAMSGPARAVPTGTRAAPRRARPRVALAITLAIQIYTSLAATATSVLAPEIGRDSASRPSWSASSSASSTRAR